MRSGVQDVRRRDTCRGHRGSGAKIACFVVAIVPVGCDGDKDSAPAVCSDNGYTSVSAGRNIACGVHTDGCVSCWGNSGLKTSASGGTWYDVGDDLPPQASFSRVVVDLGDDGFDEGGFTTCGLTTKREVMCWGRGLQDIGLPLGEALDLSVAGEVCGIGIQGGLSCWGAGSELERDTPGGRWLDVDSSTVALVNCAIGNDAQISCWGFCDEVMCSPPEGSFISLDMGTDHGCALDSDGVATCWGGYDDVAVSPSSEEQFSQVSAGSASCGVRRDGTLLCWGAPEGTPVLSAPIGTYTQVDVGDDYACAVDVSGQIVCWGNAKYGQDVPI